jgi:hypothetical protein
MGITTPTEKVPLIDGLGFKAINPRGAHRDESRNSGKWVILLASNIGDRAEIRLEKIT